jgi:hypothetical protein
MSTTEQLASLCMRRAAQRTQESLSVAALQKLE